MVFSPFAVEKIGEIAERHEREQVIADLKKTSPEGEFSTEFRVETYQKPGDSIEQQFELAYIPS